MSNNIEEKYWPCRVCGFDMEFDAWGGDENLSFSYVICRCCGSEAGVNDFDIAAVRRYRQRWLDEGCKWFSPAHRPNNWNLEEQLKLIPERWR